MTWDEVILELAERFYNAYAADKFYDYMIPPTWADLLPEEKRSICAGVAEIARPAQPRPPLPSEMPEPRPSFRPLRADATDDNPEDD